MLGSQKGDGGNPGLRGWVSVARCGEREGGCGEEMLGREKETCCLDGGGLTKTHHFRAKRHTCGDYTIVRAARVTTGS